MAQDIHYSQYFSSPLNTNPALTGYFAGDWRSGLNYRNQWATVTIPFVTYSAYADMSLLRKSYSKHYIGVGLNITQDKAGDGNLSVTHIIMSAAYHQALSHNGSTFLSVGGQFSYTQKRIEFSNLYFDEQWNDYTFDKNNVPVNELTAFKRGTYGQADANVGWNLSSTLSPTTKVYMGTAFFHLVQPADAFLNTGNSLGMRTVFTTGAYITANKYIVVSPSAYYQVEKFAKEFDMGALVSYGLAGTTDKVYFGLYNRFGDAVYPVAGYEYNGLRTLLSYDINYSSLRPASYGQGAFELSLVYTYQFMKNRPHLQRVLPCPRF
jgi:type IX secretion system PorP/SprF family membrane protein